jgi:hypothetical protein
MEDSPFHWWERRILEGPVEESLLEMRKDLINSGLFRFLHAPRQKIYDFATPLLIEEKLHWLLTQSARQIIRTLECTGKELLRDRNSARDFLALSSGLEEELFYNGLPPLNGAPLIPVVRLDMVFKEDGSPALLEVNCGCPGGEADPALIHSAFVKTTLMKELRVFLREKGLEVSFRDPACETHDGIISYYRAFRERNRELPERPTVALVTSTPQAHYMIPECRYIASVYRRRGLKVLIGDLLELVTQRDGIFIHGERIHLVVRKFSTLALMRWLGDANSLGRDLCRRVRSLWKAYLDGLFCMVNPPGSTYLQDKGLLALLRSRDPDLEGLIPETHILHPDLPSRDPFLWESICAGEEFVLKRRYSYAGRHVILDPREISLRAPIVMKEAPGKWIAQRRVAPGRYPFGVVSSDGGIHTGPLPFVLSPFGQSHFVRVGTSNLHRPIAAHSGAAETALFVIEGETNGALRSSTKEHR